jgi:hypothetical protein
LSSNRRPSEKNSQWGPWFRFYLLLFLIFCEVVAYVFQNIEKKRLGYELSVLVRHKARLMETRETLISQVMDVEHLTEIATAVEAASMEIKVSHWPVVWLPRKG